MVSRYNPAVTDRLREGAVRAWASRRDSLDLDELTIIDAPGSFELTALSAEAAASNRFVGIVALGCLIKGDTRHDEYIAHAVAHGLTEVTMRTGVPVAFGVITALTPKQARDRAGGRKGNKGQEAMDALLDTLAAIRALRSGEPLTPGSPLFSSFPHVARGPSTRSRPDKSNRASARSARK